MRDLLDASVWLPLSAPDHVHYPRARTYWDHEAASELTFCRATALALLRHLTNPRILGEAALDGGAAWRALQMWLAMPQVTFHRLLKRSDRRRLVFAGGTAVAHCDVSRFGHWRYRCCAPLRSPS